MNGMWRAARTLRWILLVGTAFFFAMSIVHVETRGDEFELYIELFLGCLVGALVIGFFERKLRLRISTPGS